jgi:hypothetical protein
MNASSKRSGVLLVLLVCAIAAAAACGAPAPVVQGRVVSSDAKAISVEDETQPAAPPIVLDISTAEIGGRTAVGDIVRVVYRAEGGTNRALAIMNVSQQQRTEAKGR